MTEPVKFTFDQAFDGGAKSRYDIELERVNEANLAALQDVREQGYSDGKTEALSGIEAQTQKTLEHITQEAQSLFTQHDQIRNEVKQEMVQLAYAIATKLSPALMRQHPITELEALIEDCMVTAHREPRLVVRVAQSLVDSVSEQIEKMKAATNFAGDIVLIGETDLGPQDCRVEWPDGGTERNQADIQREIENAVQRYVIPDIEKQPAMADDDTQTVDPALETAPGSV